MSFALVFGFLLGVLAILAVEAVLVLLLIRKLNRKNQSSQKALSSSCRDGNGDLDVRQSLDYVSKKEGKEESWCKALRVASCEDRDHLNSLVSLSRDFRSYLLCLNTGYPSLLKSSAEAYADIDDRDNRFDDSSSKVRIFLKKLAKKASRNNDSKISPAVLSSREDRKFGQRAQSFQESMSASSMAKLAAPSRVPSSLATEKMVRRSSSLSTHSNQSHITANSDADAEEKVSVDR